MTLLAQNLRPGVICDDNSDVASILIDHQVHRVALISPYGTEIHATGMLHGNYQWLAVRFSHPVSDEDCETIAALFGYAWAKNGNPKATGRPGEKHVLWPDDHTMVIHAPMTNRPEHTRTRETATRDLVIDFTHMLTEGSPVRKRIGDRLIATTPAIAANSIKWIGIP